MIITKLSVKGFRNYSEETCEFKKGLNVIVGSNACGKTNLVEAIYFLSTSRSFRTEDIDDLIMKQSDVAVLEGEFLIGDDNKKIRIAFNKEVKKITCNGYEIKKVSELAKLLNVIVFKPSDVLIFEDAPGERRRFMDMSISKMDFSYLQSLNQYEKLLRDRNEILKSNNIDYAYLDVITDQMINVERQIVLKRYNFIDRINDVINKVVVNIKGENENVKIKYYPFVVPDANYVENAKKAYKDALESDLKHRSTSIGIHRENFSTSLNGRDITAFGSQGEKRMVALSLKLCPYFLIEERALKPIVILDDVLSELDKSHQTKLLNFVSKMEQTFITTTNYSGERSNAYYVKNHKVLRG